MAFASLLLVSTFDDSVDSDATLRKESLKAKD
jgi:hypothetical protein